VLDAVGWAEERASSL